MRWRTCTRTGINYTSRHSLVPQACFPQLSPSGVKQQQVIDIRAQDPHPWASSPVWAGPWGAAPQGHCPAVYSPQPADHGSLVHALLTTSTPRSLPHHHHSLGLRYMKAIKARQAQAGSLHSAKPVSSSDAAPPHPTAGPIKFFISGDSGTGEFKPACASAGRTPGGGLEPPVSHAAQGQKAPAASSGC